MPLLQNTDLKAPTVPDYAPITPLRSARLLDSERFDWEAHYREKAEAFTSCASTWRQIAHSAQLVGEYDVVATAVTNALENEMLAKEARIHANLAAVAAKLH